MKAKRKRARKPEPPPAPSRRELLAQIQSLTERVAALTQQVGGDAEYVRAASERMRETDRVATGMWAHFVSEIVTALGIRKYIPPGLGPTVLSGEVGRALLLDACRQYARETQKQAKRARRARK